LRKACENGQRLREDFTKIPKGQRKNMHTISFLKEIM
jgi:hypothetical protein